MFWADKIASELKSQGPQWVDDMKTPSGQIHVGALRGVIIHDLVYRALLDFGIKAKYTYVFDDHDPMDSLPVYLPQEKYKKFMGFPLNKIPSPGKGAKNFAEFYALEFKEVFNKLGSTPEIIWASELYKSGKMDEGIKICLDNASKIREIYNRFARTPHFNAGGEGKARFQASPQNAGKAVESLRKKTPHFQCGEAYKKIAGADLPPDWFPFSVICEKCGKVGTTKVYAWDKKKVSYRCLPNLVEWAKGCGYEGKISPYGGTGKLPWKVEWAVKWQVIGVTVEGAGKDHMSKGGSHDIASAVCQEILGYKTPYPVPYEFFLIGGRKMSSSKGLGSSASEVTEILPPELLRFLMVRVPIERAIDFDPGGMTIPDLFDEYDRCAKDKRRVFELSQVGKISEKEIKFPRFRDVASFIQMPGVDVKKQFPDADKKVLEERIKYAKIWLDGYAPKEFIFKIAEKLPKEAKKLSPEQKNYLSEVLQLIEVKGQTPEEFQEALYNLAKEKKLSSSEAFSAIYLILTGKTSGPKAAWLLLSLDRNFLIKRFKEAV